MRQVLIPKGQPGPFRPLGIPCLRGRVAQMAAMLVLSPIVEADLQPEQYAYRAGRSALNRGSARASAGEQRASGDRGRGVVEITSGRFRTRNCCGRWRANNGCLLRWVKRWLEMAVEEDDGQGGQRRTNRVRRKGLRSCRYPAMSTCGGSS